MSNSERRARRNVLDRQRYANKHGGLKHKNKTDEEKLQHKRAKNAQYRRAYRAKKVVEPQQLSKSNSKIITNITKTITTEVINGGVTAQCNQSPSISIQLK